MSVSSSEYTERDINLKIKPIKIESCKECVDWKHTRLWIGYKFCPYCGRVLGD